jgi:two-component system, OmpR family, phosphate regulon sensor histidine kinase PhoR
MARGRSITVDLLTATALIGVAVMTGVSLWVDALGLSAGVRAGLIVASALVISTIIAVQAYRRAQVLGRLEQAATQMLSAGLPGRGGDRGDAPAVGGSGSDEALSRGRDDAGGKLLGPMVDAGIRSESSRSLAAGEAPAELAPLASAMSGLGLKIEEQLKDVAKKSRNLEALIDAIDEPILATDRDERVLLCNRSAEALLDPGGKLGLGSAGGRLIGMPITKVFTQEKVLEMHRLARDGQTRRERVSLTTPLGKRTFQVTASPVLAAWGRGVFGAVLALRDVTEMAQADAVKTDFVANASHELRTPIAAIRGAAETLQTAMDDPKMTEKLCTMIVSNALRIEEMVRDLLDLTKLESPNVRPDIGVLDMRHIERLIRDESEPHCAERRLTLTFELSPELTPGTHELRTDGKLLFLILRNLVENATKFAFEETTIRVLGTLTVTPESSHAMARFEVIDRGVGIPLDKQERVFERYYQVDPSRGNTAQGWRRGTGLGLAIVKHAARALGGKVSLSSVYGQGTWVVVEVPIERVALARG